VKRSSKSTAENSSSLQYVRDYPALCRRARDGGWAYEDLLRELFEAEAVPRESREGV
jgi:ribosome-binding protein aMBF1 (putative translation factor)